jgi:hypothetical protein
LLSLPSLHKHAFACAEINRILVEPLEPGMLMPVGEKEEQPLHFYTAPVSI